MITEKTFLRKFRKHLNLLKDRFEKKVIISSIENGSCPFFCFNCSKYRKCEWLYPRELLLSKNCPFKFLKKGEYTKSWSSSSIFYSKSLLQGKDHNLLKEMIKIVNEVYKCQK